MPQVSNDEELAQMIVDILENDPKGFVDVAALGIQLQKITGHSWNTKFKPKYGPLSDYVEKHEEFHLDNTQLYLKDKWVEVKAEQDEKIKKKQIKRARQQGKIIEEDEPESPASHSNSSSSAKGNKTANKHDKKHLPHKAGHGESVRQKERGGWCYSLFLFLIFIIFLYFAFYYLYTNNYLKPYLKPYPEFDKKLKNIVKQTTTSLNFIQKKYLTPLNKVLVAQWKTVRTYVETQVKKYMKK